MLHDTVFYTTKHYDIIRAGSPNKDEIRENYGIMNKETKVIEYYVSTFDNAMIAAETLSYILANATWRKQVELNIESIKHDQTGGGGIAPINFNS